MFCPISAIYWFWSYGSGDPQRHHFGRTECYRDVSWTNCISLTFDTATNITVMDLTKNNINIINININILILGWANGLDQTATLMTDYLTCPFSQQLGSNTFTLMHARSMFACPVENDITLLLCKLMYVMYMSIPFSSFQVSDACPEKFCSTAAVKGTIFFFSTMLKCSQFCCWCIAISLAFLPCRN